MNNDKLLRKLIVVDMVGTEAKYHRKCLIKFYSSYQKHNNDKREQANEQLMEGMAFSKALEFIEENILASDETTTPVFYLKELTEMYKKHFMRALIFMRRFSEKKDQGILKASRQWETSLEKMKNA